MLREIESAVDALRDRAWRPSDAVLADTLYTLGDAIAELDRRIISPGKLDRGQPRRRSIPGDVIEVERIAAGESARRCIQTRTGRAGEATIGIGAWHRYRSRTRVTTRGLEHRFCISA